MDKKQMILDLIDYYSNGNKTLFSKKLGVTPQTISSWLSRNTFDKELIFAKCENVSAEWLLTGNGPMLKEEVPAIQMLSHPKVPEKIIDQQSINLYDVEAAANLKTLFVNKDQNILGQISIPDIPRCDGAIYVRGDSMYPILKSGDIIAYKEIHNFDNVIYGEMYLISFDIEGDDFLTVKYINHSEKDGYVKLVSYNPHHDPKDIPVSSINALALVKFSIRKNTII